MTTLQEAKSQSVQLREALQELKREFATLGAALRNAAAEMEGKGIPIDPRLQASLESTLADFSAQRKKILNFAESCFGLEEKPFKDQPDSLDALEFCLDSALQVLLKRQKERVLEPLHKAITAGRHKGFFVPQVDNFRQQAQELLELLQTSELYDFEHKFFESQKEIAAFSAMVDLIEGGEVLDDEQCETLRQTAVKVFEKTLVMAALRGHLFLDRGVATPEFPSFDSRSKSAAKSDAKPPKKTTDESLSEEKEEEETQKKTIKAPSQFTGWPQNNWKKKEKEKNENQSLDEPSVLESRKIKKEALSPISSFSEYKNFPEKCVVLEKTLEKTLFHEIIMSAIAQRKIDDTLDFSRLHKAQAETTIQALQDWVAMSRDLSATSHEVKSILAACGFDVTEIHQERRHRVGFSAVCKLSERIHLPDNYDTSLTLGKYRISCFWGTPSEDILLTEAANALPDEIPFIFHFGILTNERRINLDKACKEVGQKLIVLDDLLILYLFTLPNNRLQELFHTALPQSHAAKLARQRMN